MSKDHLYQLSEQLGTCLQEARLVLSCAESCTGGWIAKTVTDIPGSSAWFDRGFVTYTNESKHELLGVESQLILEHGAVSEEVVREMARGALLRSRADISVAVSGIAGPAGGTSFKPVGLVWFAWANRSPETELLEIFSKQEIFAGERDAIRAQAVVTALTGILERVRK